MALIADHVPNVLADRGVTGELPSVVLEGIVLAGTPSGGADVGEELA